MAEVCPEDDESEVEWEPDPLPPSFDARALEASARAALRPSIEFTVDVVSPRVAPFLTETQFYRQHAHLPVSTIIARYQAYCHQREVSLHTASRAVVLQNNQPLPKRKPRTATRLSVPDNCQWQHESVQNMAAIQHEVQHLECSQCATNRFIYTDSYECQRCHWQVRCPTCTAPTDAMIAVPRGEELLWMCIQCPQSQLIANVQPHLWCRWCKVTPTPDMVKYDTTRQFWFCVACTAKTSDHCVHCSRELNHCLANSEKQPVCEECGVVQRNTAVIEDTTVYDHPPVQPSASSASTSAVVRLPAVSQQLTKGKNLRRLVTVCANMFTQLGSLVHTGRRVHIVELTTRIVLAAQRVHSHRLEVDTAAALLQVLRHETPPISEKVIREAFDRIGLPVRGTHAGLQKQKLLVRANNENLITDQQLQQWKAHYRQLHDESPHNKRRQLQSELTRKIRKVRASARQHLLPKAILQPCAWDTVHGVAVQYAEHDVALKRHLMSLHASHWRVVMERIKWQLALLNYVASQVTADPLLAQLVEGGYEHEVAAFCYFVAYQPLLNTSATRMRGRSIKYIGKCYHRLRLRREPFLKVWQWVHQHQAQLPAMIGLPRHDKLRSFLDQYTLHNCQPSIKTLQA